MVGSCVNTFRTCHLAVTLQYPPNGSSVWPWYSSACLNLEYSYCLLWEITARGQHIIVR